MPLSLRTPSDRKRLDVRDKPYFVRLSDSLHLGYKKGKSVSRWIARWRVRSGYLSRTIKGVVPDDDLPADNQVVLSYEQATTRVINMNVKSVNSDMSKRCGMCGAMQSEARVLFSGVSTYICDQCVRQSSEMLAEVSKADETEIGAGTVEVLLNPGIEFSIPGRTLADMIERTAFAMAESDERQYLNGLLVEIANRAIRCVATNGHYLGLCSAEIDHDIDGLQHMIVGRDDALALAKLLRDETGDATIAVKDGALVVTAGKAHREFPLLIGNYPDYRAVMPNHTSAVTTAVAPLRALLESIEADDAPLRIRMTENQLAVSTSGDDWHGLDVDYDDESFETGLDGHYLDQILAAIKGSDVSIGFSGRAGTFSFESPVSPDASYLLMPVRIWED